MHKIASPQDLQRELRQILAYVSDSQAPSRARVAAALATLADRVAASAPKDVEEMLSHAIPKLKPGAEDADFSDRKIIVMLWGFLHGLFVAWMQGAGPNYDRAKQYFKGPISEETKKWLDDVNDNRKSTLIRQALKRHWPEAYEGAMKHNLR